jgi:uncharacterized protein YndB with AHSA1/START domain
VGTEEGLRQWWGNPISLEAKEGGRCEEWRLHRGISTYWRGVVTLYAPPHELMLTLRAQEGQEEGPEFTTITIALTAHGDKTRVHVTQRSFGRTQATTTQDQKETPTLPEWRQGIPLARLQRPAPGSQPAIPATPVPDRIDPSHPFMAQPQLDVLTQTWQIRLTALAAIYAD